MLDSFPKTGVGACRVPGETFTHVRVTECLRGSRWRSPQMSIVLVLRPRCFAASKLLVCKRVVMPENKTIYTIQPRIDQHFGLFNPGVVAFE
jgi:hypothetical protein